MDRHRCAHCRNPIRHGPGVQVGGQVGNDTEPAWYHPDCWTVVRVDEQQRYRRTVAEGGLAALIAPYVASQAPVAERATAPA